VRGTALLPLALAALAALRAAGEEAPGTRGLPRGAGLSARYPGDRGIEKDPAVLLAEDFEEGEIADLGRRWTEVKDPAGKVLAWSEAVPRASTGKRSLQMTATLGRDTGGHLFGPLARGVDEAYARFYVRFPEPAEYVHHFVWLGGLNPLTRWPNPKAGVRPEGHDRVSVGIEPWGDRGRAEPPGLWNFYCYWHEMKVSADGRHWGNLLHPARDHAVPRDRWQCVEFKVRLNSKPEADDGDLSLWLDGEPVAHFEKGVRRGPWSGMGFHLLEEGGEPFEGFRWRTSPDLKLNYFWLEHYVTENAARQNGRRDPNPVNRVQFDHVVVATRYIGPIAPAQSR
jgi:hypothetical protein